MMSYSDLPKFEPKVKFSGPEGKTGLDYASKSNNSVSGFGGKKDASNQPSLNNTKSDGLGLNRTREIN